MKIIHFDSISSTNIYLKEHTDLDNLTLVYANHQTQGRGRLGRTWLDQDDLLFSILIKDNISKPLDYTFLIAITISNVLEKMNLSPLIKWPNDIIVNDKKICGILLEGVGSNNIDAIIIGTGLNINSTNYSDDLVFKATSLKLELNKDINKEEVLNLIINEFERIYKLYCDNKIDITEEVLKRFYLMNKNVHFYYKNEICSGIAKGMDNDGNIIIEANNNLYHISSGEITLNETYKA